MLSHKFVGMALVTILMFVTPAAAETNVYLLMGVQGLKGAAAVRSLNCSFQVLCTRHNLFLEASIGK